MDPLSLGVAGGLQVVSDVVGSLVSPKNLSGALANKSLVDVTRSARVEPLLLIDSDVENVSYVGDVVNSLQTLFAGYYLQAVNMIGTVGSISVGAWLAPLNPNRKLAFESADWRMVAGSYKHRLPTTHNKIAMEEEIGKIKTDSDGVKSLIEASNLSTGRVYSVTINEGGQSATVPIAIRVMANYIPTRSLIHMLSFKNSEDMDLKERYHAWRSGKISFVKDLLLCQDLIKKHRKALIQDKNGVYSQIIDRETSNKIAGLFSRDPSLATASNLAIISSLTADAIELELGGKMDSFRTREQLFDNTNLMILAVLDKGYGRVTFYTRGMHESTTVGERDLKGSSKSGGSEVMDIMKAFIAGSAPSHL